MVCRAILLEGNKLNGTIPSTISALTNLMYVGHKFDGLDDVATHGHEAARGKRL